MIIFEIGLPKCALDAYQQTCVEGLYAVGERQTVANGAAVVSLDYDGKLADASSQSYATEAEVFPRDNARRSTTRSNWLRKATVKVE